MITVFFSKNNENKSPILKKIIYIYIYYLIGKNGEKLLTSFKERGWENDSTQKKDFTKKRRGFHKKFYVFTALPIFPSL